MMKKLKKKKGFTLIELIVVIAILAVLVLLASPLFLGRTQEAVFTKHISNTKIIQNASELYFMDEDDWPRLTDEPYSSEEIEEYAESIYTLTGETIELDPNGNYYDINYNVLNNYVSVNDEDKPYYILQNPVGKVYYMDGLSELGKNRADFNSSNGSDSSNNESVAIREPNADEIPIYTAQDLNNIRNNQSAKYILMEDIDLSSYSNWTPIGRSTYSSKAGSIDGNGFKIRNLRINSSGDNIGLFGNVSGLVVRNLALEDVDIVGRMYVGAIAGDLSNSTIENSYVTGKVSGFNAGMLTGRTYNGVSVKNSYAVGTIINDSYSKGGLFGDFYNSSKVVNSYAAVDIIGRGGGIAYKINSSSGASASGVYWDTQLSGKTSAVLSGNADGTKGLTTENMKKQDNFVDWDFENVWQINEGKSYPYLRDNPQYPAPGSN